MKAITLTAMMVSFNAFALTETINGIEWSYERCDDGLAITGSVIPDGKMDIVVPDTIGGVPVVEIGEGAVASETFDRSLIAGSNPLYYSLKLPAQVRRIKTKAFFNRRFSPALIFPETLETLDRFAFGRWDVYDGSYAHMPMSDGFFSSCQVEFYGKRPRVTNDLGLSYPSKLLGGGSNGMFYNLSVWVQNNWCSEYAEEEYDTSSDGFVHRFEKGYLFDYPSFEFSCSDFDKDAGGGLVTITPTRCELKLHEESRFYKCNDMAIYYTVNGEDPVAKETQTCFKYTKPFLVASNVVLKVWSGVGKISAYQCRVVDYVKDVVFDNCGVFNDSKCSVSLSCATEGALIYYTLDGSEPSAENGTLYTGTFTIYESVTVKAIAFKDDWLASEVASATFEKANKLSEAGGLLNYLPESDADYPWSVTADDSHDGKSAIKSGEIAAGESTWMKVSVPGTGRITFWWKRTGNGNAVFKVDDEIAAESVEAAGWQKVAVDVRAGGAHTLRWEYSGDGCVLLDGMEWSAVVNDELTNFRGEYDGQGHSISVAAEQDATACVTYALTADGQFTSEKPTFTNVIEGTTVWYRVESPDYLGGEEIGSATVTITAKPLTAGMIKVAGECVYDGTEKKPEFAVEDGEPSIITEMDWQFVEYGNNTKAGIATIRIAAIDGGNYCGEAIGAFEIRKADYDMSGVSWTGDRSVVYDGQTHGVALTGLPEGVTATLTGHEAKDAGTYTATAALIYDAENFVAPNAPSCEWEICKRDLVLRVADKDKCYDGTSLAASAGDVAGEGYVEGETLDYYDFTSQTEMGSAESSFSFRDSDSAKASNYNVTVVGGKLRVTIGGSVYAGEVVSAKMRENDKTILDVKYIVGSITDAVDVRLVVFKDGVRDFANVILPETFVDGTEGNVGDGVLANVTNTIAWRVSEDWNVDLAKVKVEVLVKPSETYLPFRWVTIPGRNGHRTIKVSTNEIDGGDLFNALLWCYADRDAKLSLADGVLKFEGVTLVSGGEISAAATGYVFGKMGCGILEGDELDYARAALRKPLTSEKAYNRYATMIIGE